MSKQPCVIIDINGTLGDCTQRAHFLDADPRDWDGCAETKPLTAYHKDSTKKSGVRSECIKCRKLSIKCRYPGYRRILKKENLECLSCKTKRCTDLGRPPFQFGGDFGGVLFEGVLCIYCLMVLHDDERKCYEHYKKNKSTRRKSLLDELLEKYPEHRGVWSV